MIDTGGKNSRQVMSQPIAKAARVPFSFQELGGREERLPLTLLQVQARRVTKPSTWSLRQMDDSC